jgi:hypothetical protein
MTNMFLETYLNSVKTSFKNATKLKSESTCGQKDYQWQKYCDKICTKKKTLLQKAFKTILWWSEIRRVMIIWKKNVLAKFGYKWIMKINWSMNVFWIWQPKNPRITFFFSLKSKFLTTWQKKIAHEKKELDPHNHKKWKKLKILDMTFKIFSSLPLPLRS